jgi:hypothetical protein
MSEPQPLATHQEQFHVAEYTSLHGEIRELITEARTLERQGLFAIGAVWAWLAIHGKDVARFVLLIGLAECRCVCSAHASDRVAAQTLWRSSGETE